MRRVRVDEHDGGDPGVLRVDDDPWQDAAGAGLWVPDQAAPVMPRTTSDAGPDDRSAVYLEVQRSAAFQEVRESYRRFVFPVVAGFLGWYLLYVVAAISAPGLM